MKVFSNHFWFESYGQDLSFSKEGHTSRSRSQGQNYLTKWKVLSQRIHICNMKTLSLLIWKLWPRLKFLFTHHILTRMLGVMKFGSSDICSGSRKSWLKYLVSWCHSIWAQCQCHCGLEECMLPVTALISKVWLYNQTKIKIQGLRILLYFQLISVISWLETEDIN